jgi:hypothetical protein
LPKKALSMKITKIIFPLLFLFCFASCIEINEQIDVKSNGSGEWVMHMDMSQLLDLMQNYIPKEEMDKQLPDKKMDTTIWFKNIIDTAKNISPEKKALVRDGKMSMKLNMEQKIFNTDMSFPFKNLDNLQKLCNSMGDGSLGTNQLLKGMSGGTGDNASPGGNMQQPDFNQFNGIYDFKSSDGHISRKLNPEKLKALQANPQFDQMKQASSMGAEIPYTLTVNLPRPVKKVDNALAKISDDKKTVTIKYNIIEMLDNPQKFEYSIEY